MSDCRTTDNSSKDIDNFNDFNDKDVKNIAIIANKKINEIKLNENRKLIIFPPFSKSNDISEERICSLHNNVLYTNNIMGFAGVNDTTLTITSRFTKNDKIDAEKDYFLHYMLQKVLSINTINFDQLKNNNPIWNFYPYLFPYYLKRAVSQGIFKSYQTINNNDLNIKGVIDVKRHLNKNIPFRGKVAYTNRIYSQNNEITQLIRHTIEEIKSSSFAPILKNDKDTVEAVQRINAVTETYDKNERNKIIAKNNKPARHPYFYKYRELQKLCLLILRRKKLSFGQEKDKIYGLLFDGAWLWEEYLAKVFEKKLPGKFIHPQNKTGAHKDWLFEDEDGKDLHEIYPDFISKYKPYIIADAKYKFLNKKGYEKDYGREDFFQILSYMLRYSSKEGYLLFPYKQEDGNKQVINYEIKKTDIKLKILGLKIPIEYKDFKDFKQKMEASEEEIIKEFPA